MKLTYNYPAFLRLTIWVPAAALAAVLVCSFAVSPLFISMASDVSFSDSILPLVLQVVQLFLNTAYLSLLAGYVVCAVWFGRNERQKYPQAVLAICVGIVFFKFAADLVSSLIFDGKFDFHGIALALVTPILDALFVLVIYLVAGKTCQKQIDYADEMRRAGKYLKDVDIEEKISIYPFPGLFSFRHPVLLPLFVFGAALLVFSMGPRAVYDIGYGAAADLAEAVDMVFAYLSDLLVAFVAYVISYFTAVFIFIKKIKADEAE